MEGVRNVVWMSVTCSEDGVRHVGDEEWDMLVRWEWDMLEGNGCDMLVGMSVTCWRDVCDMLVWRGCDMLGGGV